MQHHQFYTQMGRRGKGLAAGETERESVCARDGEWLKTELASIIKTAIGRRMNYFEISRNSNVRITFSWETILMGKKDLQRYIKIKIMSENASRYLVLRHLVHFPYMNAKRCMSFCYHNAECHFEKIHYNEHILKSVILLNNILMSVIVGT